MQDKKMQTEVIEWSNKDNNAFYEAVKADGLKELARKAGLVSGCDMKVLTPYWTKAESILEVGAGYGRVIDYLLEHQFKGTITAVERCNTLFDHLETQFGEHKNVHLVHQDILELDIDNIGSFDLVLMLWSGLADFLPKEQRLVFKKLGILCAKMGKCIIDTLPEFIIPLNSDSTCDQRTYKQQINNATIFTYSISLAEVKKTARLARFYNIWHENYYTETNRKRILHILG